MADTYVVKAGDTLSEIAQKLKSQYGFDDTYEFVEYLAELNDLTDPNYIVTGQTIQLSGTATTRSTNTTSRATIKLFGLQSNTDRTMYATWNWDKDNTANYQCMWYYATGDGIWFIGNDGTTNHKQNLYTAPSNATKVKFKVKPKSETKTVDGKETTYWTADWSTEVEYNFSDNPPSTPDTPTVTIEKYKLTATLDGLDDHDTYVQFQIVQDNDEIFKTVKAPIVTSHAECTVTIEAGHEYKVRCRAMRDDMNSGWSEYSGNVGTVPAAVKEITELKALSETSVRVDWTGVKNAESYTVEYTTQKRYFDSSAEVQSMSVINGMSHAEVTGLQSGEQYFFRLRAVNKNGESDWTEPKSIIIGKAPAAPTTWSSTTTAVVGESLTLYWLHNSEDGSTQTGAHLEIYFGSTKKVYNISTPDSEEDKTNSYEIDTTAYPEGTKIKWRVQTCGITGEYGDWSTQRTIDIYAPPSLSLRLTNSAGSTVSTLTRFPLYVVGSAGPSNQKPVSYHVSVTSNEAYESVDPLGNPKHIAKGAEIFSKYLDISGSLKTALTASNINLDNNITYTVTVTVAMNSGLNTTSSATFKVSWEDLEYEPNAEISIDKDSYSAYITPYCQGASGTLVSNVKLAVYRREFDGSFTEIETEIKNNGYVTVTDPHPALDYARYRIVATTEDTGAISYCDLAGIPINAHTTVLQWDERWSDYNNPNEDVLVERTWGGSLLKLPYNIDISDNYSPDVVLVEYEGRESPTSYYGTQIGHTATWNMAIDKTDSETLYALRRLSRWMGDVYVREPSGSGYWANVTVSFSQKYSDLTIPISLTVTRVSGGV